LNKERTVLLLRAIGRFFIFKLTFNFSMLISAVSKLKTIGI